ncbi:helix-turn-helix domain-containing protein [Falsiroseomonas sp.]|uniref:helix-turn-helix domain-containing protein n=1 Tax=Falsiroseomonas sp. TaxID=2870721 RepID=UPI003568DAFE
MSQIPHHGKRKPEDRPPPPPNAITYTIPDAARMSGLSPSTLRRRASTGELQMRRNGGRTLVCGASLRRMLQVGEEG